MEATQLAVPDPFVLFDGEAGRGMSACTMAAFPDFGFSKNEVRRAGEVIASSLVWSPETEEEILQAFKVANSWRDSHAYPMRSIRNSVIQHIHHAGLDGLTAARLKRMQAIRRKLRRTGATFLLNQLQDLGGCRAIMDDIGGVRVLADRLRSQMRHEIRKEDDYISNPKGDGYRCHHLMLSFVPDDPERASFAGRRIELQIRTRLQHSWATAVEAVGLFRGEDLKGHQGSPEWLRLFSLISAEFAEMEGCPLPPGTLDKADRVSEIKRLAGELSAAKTLESIKHGVRGTDFPISPNYRPTHYLIVFDHATQSVRVTPAAAPVNAAVLYDSAEFHDNRADSDTQTVVLVEVDKMESLKAAYPNYFGDVTLFGEQLESITRTGFGFGYGVAPRQPAPRPREKWGDLSWLRRRRFPQPSLKDPEKKE
ncbi:RelA/SpoT domain-containing protein [Pararoseomonas sp. SCSIO 73927]|uniref:RelA/SpoT domain-containing protein n=1 Tax=Pararoseomonas sp. SCSIO 73927 TaxID=3114537 RepID=UPI0030CDA76F